MGRYTTNNLPRLSYDDAARILSGRDSLSLCFETTLERIDADTIGVRHHRTIIVRIHRCGDYTVTTGGWYSRTTLARINALSPIRIGSERGEHYVWTGLYARHGMRDVWTTADERAARVPFVDGMRVDSNGWPADMRDALPIPDSVDPDDWRADTVALRERARAADTGVPCYTSDGRTYAEAYGRR